jgi:hypothetical protein
MALRLQADDPDVGARTDQALNAAATVKPLLRFRCDTCRKVVLAIVGDVPGYGGLFTSSWAVEPDGHRVVANGRELKGRERKRWIAEHDETIEESGAPIDDPLMHGVVALLEVPAGMTDDYPDLLMRCETHGDFIADRLKTLKRLRKATRDGKPADIYVSTTGENYSYTLPTSRPGGVPAPRRVARRLKPSITHPPPQNAAELAEKKRSNAEWLRRRRSERIRPDAPNASDPQR